MATASSLVANSPFFCASAPPEKRTAAAQVAAARPRETVIRCMTPPFCTISNRRLEQPLAPPGNRAAGGDHGTFAGSLVHRKGIINFRKNLQITSPPARGVGHIGRVPHCSL